MKILTSLESRFGLTRGDITVTLFLVATALAGFIYVTFFDTRPEESRRDMALLFAHRDSVVAARQAREEALRRALTDSTAAGWSPPGAEEERRDSVEGARSEFSGGGGGSGAKHPPSSPIDLNKAPIAELMRLPGVGEKTARAIVEMRGHLPFRRVEDLMNVKGIGEKKLAKMRPYIVVR